MLKYIASVSQTGNLTNAKQMFYHWIIFSVLWRVFLKGKEWTHVYTHATDYEYKEDNTVVY